MAPSHNQNEPLLPPKAAAADDVQPLSPRTNVTIKALSALRIGAGVACLVAPRWTCALFRFPIPADMTILTRLFGGRDLILGELLLTAEDKNSPDRGRREIKRAFWAGLAVDAIDVGSIVFCMANGSLGRVPGALFIGAAATGLGLGTLGLRGL